MSEAGRCDRWVKRFAHGESEAAKARSSRWERDITAKLKTHLASPSGPYKALIVIVHSNVPGWKTAEVIREAQFKAWRDVFSWENQKLSVKSEVLFQEEVAAPRLRLIYAIVEFSSELPDRLKDILAGNTQIIWAGVEDERSLADQILRARIEKAKRERGD
jgi:hypothetical protein